MPRLLVYGLLWLLCNLATAACAICMAILLVLFTAIGPFACVYVGARLGMWCGFNLFMTALLMIGGLWLFGSVRATLFRTLWRWWRWGRQFLTTTIALRDDVWRQYRRQFSRPFPKREVRP